MIEKPIDNVLMSSVTLPAHFDGEEFLDAVDEIFQDSNVVSDYDAKVFDAEKRRLTAMVRSNGRGVDKSKIASAFYDFSLCAYIYEVTEFMKAVEAEVLPKPILSAEQVSDTHAEPPGSAMKKYSTSDWSDSRREQEGPYATESTSVDPAADPTSAGGKRKRGSEKEHASSPQPLAPEVEAESEPEPESDTGAKRGRGSRQVGKGSRSNKPSSSAESETLRQQASEFAKKSNRKDPLNNILSTPAAPVPARRGDQGTMPSPIDEDSISELSAESPVTKSNTANKNKSRRLNSPSRRGGRVEFNSPVDHGQPASNVLGQIHATMAQGTRKADLPNKLASPTKKVETTADNVLTVGRRQAPRVRWTAEEEEVFIAAVAKYGPGKWASILWDPEFQLLSKRTNVNLKDKYRNMLKDGKF